MHGKKFNGVFALHPVKWSPLLSGSKSHREFLCKIVLPWIGDPKGHVPNIFPKPYEANESYMYTFVKNLNEKSKFII